MTERRVVALREYETSEPVPLGTTDLALLESVPEGRLTARPTPTSGLFTLQATSWVGSVVLPGVEVRIRPKVSDLRNVLMMFGSVSGLADWSPPSVGYAPDDLVEGVTELVLRTVDGATARGLLHGYESREDRLPVLRGRIDMQELATRPWESWPVPCRYDDFTADIGENRVLLAAITALRPWARTPEAHRLVQRLTHRLDGVSQSPVPLLEADRIIPTPLNEHYQPALGLARQVLEGHGVAHTGGDRQGQSFLVDMNVLFERWIGQELRDRLWPRLDVAEQAPVPLSRRPTVTMAPDLVFRRSGRRAGVADVKYKLTGTGFARTGDYYQLLAYLTALELRCGVLIYCQSDEAPPREITVEGGGQRIICHPVDLSGDRDSVQASLDGLVETLRRMSEQVSATAPATT